MDEKIGIKKSAEAMIPTDWGKFNMVAYASEHSNYVPHLALVHPEMDTNKSVVIRIHSECLTGDLFHSQRCDCGQQLDAAMRKINEEKGILIYLRQEGRGIGLINKLHAYNKQDEGLDTVEANLALGLEIDGRDYEKAIDILLDLDVEKITLLTNNPEKIKAFDNAPVKLTGRLPLEIEANQNNHKYLETKKASMGHLLHLKK